VRRWLMLYRIRERAALLCSARLLVHGVRTLRGRMFVAGTGGGVLALSLWGGVKPVDEAAKKDAGVIKEADILYEAYLIDNLYRLLSRYKLSDNPEVLWRLARAACEKGKLSKDKNERKELIYEAYTHIQLALERETPPGISAVHKWYAILLDYVGEYEGTKARIEKAYTVREHMELAIKLDPSDATSRHIFGLWQYIFADMPTYQRRIAAWIYATPPTATYEEALETFLAAEHTQPNFYSKNLLYIGRCMIKLGQMNKGVEYLRRAYAAPVVTADDMETKNNSERELKQLNQFESAF